MPAVPASSILLPSPVLKTGLFAHGDSFPYTDCGVLCTAGLWKAVRYSKAGLLSTASESRTQNRPFCSRKSRETTGTPGILRGVTIFGDIQCHLAEGRCRRGQYGARGLSRCHRIWRILVTPGEEKLRRGCCRNGGLSRCHCFHRFPVTPRRCVMAAAHGYMLRGEYFIGPATYTEFRLAKISECS